MSLRSVVRGLVLASVGALAVLGVAAGLSPELRHRALRLAGRTPEPEPQQPTHIVLPDRAVAAWEGLDEAIEEGREAGSDVALAGA
jgi:hypothetical protein